MPQVDRIARAAHMQTEPFLDAIKLLANCDQTAEELGVTARDLAEALLTAVDEVRQLREHEKFLERYNKALSGGLEGVNRMLNG